MVGRNASINEALFDVLHEFTDDISAFPMRMSFCAVAEALSGTVPAYSGGMFEYFKNISRESTSSWTAEDANLYLSATSSAKRAVQATRCSVKLINIMMSSLSCYGLTCSAEVNDDGMAARHMAVCEEELKRHTALNGLLPFWIKSLPVLTVLHIRCAVKVVQKRFVMARGDTDLDEIVEVHAKETLERTQMEIDYLCTKLELFFNNMRKFFHTECVPDCEVASDYDETLKVFKKSLRQSKEILGSLNTILPIMYGVFGLWSGNVSNAWLIEAGFDGGWQLAPPDQDSFEGETIRSAGLALYDDSSVKERGMFFENLKELLGVARGASQHVHHLANVQISVFATGCHVCVEASQTNNEKLHYFGYQEADTAPNSERNAKKRRSAVLKSTPIVRNTVMQSEIYGLWKSVIEADRSLEEHLLNTNLGNSALQLYISDDWYRELFQRTVIPAMFSTLLAKGVKLEFSKLCGRQLRKIADKVLRKQ